MTEHIRSVRTAPRFQAVLFGSFSLVAVLLAGVAVAGLGLGRLGAVSLTRFLERFLFEIGSLDLTPFSVAVVALLGVVTLAVVVPARRATRVDCAESLHME